MKHKYDYGSKLKLMLPRIYNLLDVIMIIRRDEEYYIRKDWYRL